MPSVLRDQETEKKRRGGHQGSGLQIVQGRLAHHERRRRLRPAKSIWLGQRQMKYERSLAKLHVSMDLEPLNLDGCKGSLLATPSTSKPFRAIRPGRESTCSWTWLSPSAAPAMSHKPSTLNEHGRALKVFWLRKCGGGVSPDASCLRMPRMSIHHSRSSCWIQMGD